MAVENSPVRGVRKQAGPTGVGAGTAADPGLGLGPETEEDARWRPVLGLPCELTVDLPLPGFTISDLLRLRKGSVLHAHWRAGRDVPLRLNGMLIGRSEFEVVGENLAVRLTELA